MKLFSYSCVMMSVAGSTALHAQTVAPQQGAASPDASSTEIVVTAQRRSERLQDVPIAVTAVSGAKMEAAHISTLEQIAIVTPGLTMTNTVGTVQPYIRGVGTQNSAPGEESSISTYIDGVYIGAIAGTTLSLPDVERIEVLKGPQGTLFGRNATGGLIQIITRTPTSTPQFNLTVEGASYGTISARGYAAGPLSDTLAASITVGYNHQADGWGHNFTTNREVNLTRDFVARSKFVWSPEDSTTVTLSGDYQNARSDLGQQRRILPGQIPLTGYADRGGRYDTQSQVTALGVFRQMGGSMIVHHDFGGISLDSTTAYRHYRFITPTDNDGGPIRVLDTNPASITNTFQQELLLRGDFGNLTATSGLFYYYGTARYNPNQNRSGTNPATNRDLFSRQRTNSGSAFLDLSYHFNESTTLTVGGRYTIDRKSFLGGFQAVPEYVGPAIAPPVAGTKTFRKPTGRAVLDHKFNRDLMVYASVSRGFKAGGFNLNSPPNPPVESETLTAYEVGLKSQWFDRRLRINISAFDYKYSNVQLQSLLSPGVTTLLNAAVARVKGIDGDIGLTIPAGDGNFSIDANGAYAHNRYSRFPGAPFFYPSPVACNAPGTSNPGVTTGPLTGGLTLCSGDASGNRLIKTPTFSGSLTLGYDVGLGTGRLAMGLTASYSSSVYFTPDNVFKQPGYTLLNATVSYQIGAYRIYAFGTNITNKRYLNQLSASAFGPFVSYGAPSIFGGGVNYSF